MKKIEKRAERQKKHKRSMINIIRVMIMCLIVFIFGIISNIKYTDCNTKKTVSNDLENIDEVKHEENGKQSDETEDDQKSKEIIISAIGDCTLGSDDKFSYYGSFNNQAEKYNYDYSKFLSNVSGIFKNDDYTIANLETTFTDSKNKRNKGDGVQYNFKGRSEYAKILTSAGVDGVTISNNHIYDYGTEGFNDTLKVLNNNKIDYCGENNKILKDINGVKVGFLGYTAWEYTNELKKKISNDIKELRESGAQVVIPYFHWGIEGQYKPYDTQTLTAKYAIDNGADLVLGSHPHVIQSIEQYKEKLIVYSLGNFCFGGNTNPNDKDTFIFQVKINLQNDMIQDMVYNVIPARISSTDSFNDYTPSLLNKSKNDKLIKKIKENSINLNKSIQNNFKKNDE